MVKKQQQQKNFTWIIFKPSHQHGEMYSTKKWKYFWKTLIYMFGLHCMQYQHSNNLYFT